MTTLMLPGSEHQGRWLLSAPATLVELEGEGLRAGRRERACPPDLPQIAVFGTRRRLWTLRVPEHLENLRLLDVQATAAVIDFSDLRPSLQILGLTGCRGLRSLDAVVSSAPLLQRLWLDDCGQIESLQPLQRPCCLSAALAGSDHGPVRRCRRAPPSGTAPTASCRGFGYPSCSLAARMRSRCA